MVGTIFLDKLKMVKKSSLSSNSKHLNPSSNEDFLNLSYKFILRRKPDKQALLSYLPRLNNGEITRDHLLDQLVDSREFSENFRFRSFFTSLHESRSRFIKQLPKGDVIVDLGGSCQENEIGALVIMGYPYHFKELTIVDLPMEECHPLYQKQTFKSEAQSDLGPIKYLYNSMTDLSHFADNSVDLVYSGQSIEHVTPEDGEKTLKEVYRILKPGGYLALDTPNGAVTRIQQDEFVDPDHEVEYTHNELSQLLTDNKFLIKNQKGLNHKGSITCRENFSEKELAKNCGLYDDIENCYLLAYVCQKPEHIM